MTMVPCLPLRNCPLHPEKLNMRLLSEQMIHMQDHSIIKTYNFSWQEHQDLRVLSQMILLYGLWGLNKPYHGM